MQRGARRAEPESRTPSSPTCCSGSSSCARDGPSSGRRIRSRGRALAEAGPAVREGPRGRDPDVARGRDLPGALRNLEEAEQEAGDDPEVLARIAALYSGAGAPPEFQAKAARIWNRVLALNPVDVRARFFVTIAPLLAVGAVAAEDLERILATLDAIIASDPDFEPARVRYFRALALERLGRHEEAAGVTATSCC